MNKLIIVNMNGQQTIDSRLVAEALEIRHKDLLEKIRNYEQILISGKFRSLDFFISSTYKDSRNREKPCYMLTKKGCEMVANKTTGQKGVIFTAMYVEAFNQMEQQVSYKLPSTYKEALIELVHQVEENEKLQLDNKIKEKQIIENQPYVDFAKQVSDSVDLIDMNQMAKLIRDEGYDIGRNRLFKQLRDMDILMKNNMPYQRYVNQGYFQVKESASKTAYGNKIFVTTMVTGKGQIYIMEKIRNQNK